MNENLKVILEMLVWVIWGSAAAIGYRLLLNSFRKQETREENYFAGGFLETFLFPTSSAVLIQVQPLSFVVARIFLSQVSAAC